MSNREKIIAKLEAKGLLDPPTIQSLKKRLNHKLKMEQAEQLKELSMLREELSILQKKLAI